MYEIGMHEEEEEVNRKYYLITLVERTCFKEDSSWRSSCSRSFDPRGPKSSPSRFLLINSNQKKKEKVSYICSRDEAIDIDYIFMEKSGN